MNFRDLVVLCLVIAAAAAWLSRRSAGVAESSPGTPTPVTRAALLPTPARPRIDPQGSDLHLDLPTQDVTVLEQQGRQALIQVNMRGHNRLKLRLDFDGPSQDWSFNLGDSRSNNGYGGDSGNQSNDAELQICNGNLAVYGSDQLGDKTHLLKSWTVQGTPLTMEVADGELVCAGDAAFRHPALFALKGQPDSEGPVNYDLFIGVNRVVAGGRTGSGVSGLSLQFSDD